MKKEFIICFSPDDEKRKNLINQAKSFFSSTALFFSFSNENELLKELPSYENSTDLFVFLLQFESLTESRIRFLNELTSACLRSVKLLISESNQLIKVKKRISNLSSIFYLPEPFTADTFELTIYLIKDKLEKLESAVASVIDTESEELIEYSVNKKLKRLIDENITKDKFNAVIAHDLKNSFGVLLGISEILIDNWQNLGEPDKLELTKDVRKTVEDTYELLENLLHWSRSNKIKIESKPSAVKVHSIVNGAIKMAEKRAIHKNIEVQNQIDKSLKITTDANMLSTVFRNLITNAVKYTPEGGLININAEQQNGHLTFCVSDNGEGIDKPYILELFAPKPKHKNEESNNGTNGLGLFLCKEFVERNGGKIWLETKMGLGSKFFFSVPENTKGLE